MSRFNTKQRHNWPRKNEGLRIYRERGGSYMLVDPSRTNNAGNYDAIVNMFVGENPSLCSGCVERGYLGSSGCKRVQWSEVPPAWQSALLRWLDDKPESIRGFWLVNNIPSV